MIKKIVSGGQTGADQAALDAAIESGIAHGGWIHVGQLIEADKLPEKYQLKEMSSISDKEPTEQNVIDSDGTVIISHGDLANGSRCKYAQEMCKKHNRPCLHIDLNITEAFAPAVKIIGWIYGFQIEVLNVAGPRESKDPKLYQAVKEIIKDVINMNNIVSMIDEFSDISDPPKSVDEAVSRLQSELELKDKNTIAKMAEDDLNYLHMNLGVYIRDKFDLRGGNVELINECRLISGKKNLHPDAAAMVIIKELWERLKETHTLRVVK